jgi:3-deoxy-D-manno-octulosonate 8-phosphate phosphatase (KDO 8-P phosphatase)
VSAVIPSTAALARIRFLLTDVDGVLTDGRLHFDAHGNEYKTFHVHDAAGLVYWHRSGGLSGFVSGRRGRIVEMRAEELGVQEVHLGRLDKVAVLDEILARRSLAPAEVAYVGDDLLDIPAMRRVGLAATVPNARPEVKAIAHYVTSVAGGDGAVREVVELLMRARGRWDEIVRKDGMP